MSQTKMVFEASDEGMSWLPTLTWEMSDGRIVVIGKEGKMAQLLIMDENARVISMFDGTLSECVKEVRKNEMHIDLNSEEFLDFLNK